MSYTEFTLRLLVGLAAGLFIGIEREWQKKPAGLRTNTLVATGAALFVLLSFNISGKYEIDTDVTRIIGQVVTGIGFIGAGIIFKEGGDIYGLTTAATIWCSAAVGCLAGSGYFIEVIIGTVTIVSINLLLIPVDKWLSKRADEKEEQKNNGK